MAKRLKYNSDYMSDKMDSYMEQIEDRLSALYADAAKEMQEKLTDFMDGYEKQRASMEAQVEAGKMTEEEYSQWCNRHIVQSDKYKSTIDELSTMAVNADVAAMAMVNGAMPMVVAQSYNFTESLGFEAANKAGLTQGTFQIYNERSVQKIIKENPNLLKEVDMDADTKWNREKLNREISQGIIQGESIDKIADRLQRVTDMDRNAAVRNARTMMTGAENMGRAEAADDLKAQGIPMDEVWSATYDNRTRESHLELDGTVRDENGLFGVGIINKPLRYPADPEGDPEEIYNCRCRLSLQLKGVDHSKDQELYENFMKENFPQTWETMQEKDSIKNALETYSKKQEEIAERQSKTLEDMIIPAPEKVSLEDVKEEALKDGTPEMPQSVRDAYDKFEDKYIDSPKEHGMLFDKDGNLLSESQSKRNESVSIASESMYEDHGQGAYEIHNHTADELFSWKDISNYEKYGMNGTITIPSGWEFTLYNSNEPRWNWDDTKRMETEWLASAWSEAQETISDEWTQERRAFIDSVQGYDRQEQRRLVREWEGEHSRLDMQIQWLEDHSEEYGFEFEKRRLK